jgi:hypothetical protein
MSDSVISAIIGGIVGSVASFLFVLWMNRSDQRQQTQAVRTLISLEIEHNLMLLRSFWERVNKAISADVNAGREVHNMISEMVALPLPRWSRRAWESQIALLPQAVDSEIVLKQIHAHYTDLELIVAIRDQIMILRQAPRTLTGDNIAYSINTPILYDECKRIVTDMLDVGNPLQKNKKKR